MKMDRNKLTTIFNRLYPDYDVQKVIDKLSKIISKYSYFQQTRPRDIEVSKEVALSVYPDTFVGDGGKKLVPTLQLLNQFLQRYELHRYFSILHILPFYPWDTDRGFSILDYYKVDIEYGDWSDIAALGQNFKLMTGLVLNHVSANSSYVQGALIERHLDKSDSRYNNYAAYKDFVIAFSDDNKPSDTELSKINRPRSTPVLTPYICYEYGNNLFAVLGESLPSGAKVLGKGWVWTTFSRPSKDKIRMTRQVDLNYKNPNVLLEIIKVLLFYVSQGITYIRLDAAAMIWKELGTNCAYLPQVYDIIRILRIVLNDVAPDTKLVIEAKTSIEKMSSFVKQGVADYVFQYAFFPLYLYSLYKQDFSYFTTWIDKIKVLGNKQVTTIFGSHDGLELKTLHGILSSSEIDKFANFLKEKGVLTNWAMRPGGERYISEVCSTPWSLVKDATVTGDSFKHYIDILSAGLKVPGVTNIYINGLLGVEQHLTGNEIDENRTVNRERFDVDDMMRKIDTTSSHEHKVFNEVLHILSKR